MCGVSQGRGADPSSCLFKGPGVRVSHTECASLCKTKADVFSRPVSLGRKVDGTEL